MKEYWELDFEGWICWASGTERSRMTCLWNWNLSCFSKARIWTTRYEGSGCQDVQGGKYSLCACVQVNLFPSSTIHARKLKTAVLWSVLCSELSPSSLKLNQEHLLHLTVEATVKTHPGRYSLRITKLWAYCKGLGMREWSGSSNNHEQSDRMWARL